MKRKARQDKTLLLLGVARPPTSNETDDTLRRFAQGFTQPLRSLLPDLQ